MPLSPLDRLDQDAGGLGGDGVAQRVEIAERHVIEAVHRRAKAGQVFLLPARRDGRQGAAVEGALAANDAVTLGMADRALILAHQLDTALHRLGAGVVEEHGVGEAVGDQTLGEALLVGNLVKVGDVPQLFGLRLERLDQMRMAMAQRGDRDT